MTKHFLTQPVDQGRYEPEGLYLSVPLQGTGLVAQGWGEHPQFYRSFEYNGIPLKGHNGVDFVVNGAETVVVVDDGQIMGIGMESGGYGRYVKVEHRWGESFYAHLGRIHVDAGQIVTRGTEIARVEWPTLTSSSGEHSYLHFGIRIKPYNRFDGWGGFTDPIPFLDPTNLAFVEQASVAEAAEQRMEPHAMLRENKNIHRP